MNRRTIRTDRTEVACDVCGRRLLRGEEAEAYLAGGERRQVCELCTARAVHEGWIREAAASAELPARRVGSAGRPTFLDRWRQRREEGELPGVEPVLMREAEPAAAPPPVVRARQPAPAAPPTRQVHAVPTNDELKLVRGIELFNTSHHTRTIAGVARSLGVPLATVHTSADGPSVVRLVVGWELSWYRFELDLADEAGGVQVVDRGYELSELDEDDRAWNAQVDDHGHLALGAAAAPTGI